MWEIIGGFFTALISPVTEVVKGHQRIKKAKVDAEIKRIQQGTDADIQMDAQSNSRIWWADDLTFFLGTLIIALSFYPPAVPAIKAGFLVLEGMPDWFLYGYGMMMISVWGYRRLVLPIVEVIVKKSIMGKK